MTGNAGRKPLFHNLVDVAPSVMRRMGVVFTVAIACCCGGCGINRVAVSTRLHGIPIRLEVKSNGNAITVSDSVSIGLVFNKVE